MNLKPENASCMLLFRVAPHKNGASRRALKQPRGRQALGFLPRLNLPRARMSLASRAALGSLLGSSKRVNSTQSEDKIIGSKQTPNSKNNSAAWSSEFFQRSELSSWTSKSRANKNDAVAPEEPPPFFEAFGVTGVLENHVGHLPTEAEAFGEVGFLQSMRGHTPVGEHGRSNESEATDLAEFFKEHADCELLPGGRVRCATTNTELPLSFFWLRKHWEGHKYRRTAEKLAAHALAAQIAAEEAEAWTMVDVENVDAARMDRVYAAQCAMTAELEASAQGKAAEAERTAAWRAAWHEMPPDTPPSSLLAEPFSRVPAPSPLSEGGRLDRVFASACAATKAALIDGDAAEAQALPLLKVSQETTRQPEEPSVAGCDAPVMQLPAAPIAVLDEQLEAPLSTTKMTTRQTRCNGRSSQRPPPPPKDATDALDATRLARPGTAPPPCSPCKEVEPAALSLSAPAEPASAPLRRATGSSTRASAARLAQLTVPASPEGVRPLGCTAAEATSGPGELGEWNTPRDEVDPSPSAARAGAWAGMEGRESQRSWLQREFESCESEVTTILARGEHLLQGELPPAISDAISELPPAISDAISELPPAISDAISDLPPAISDAISDGADAVTLASNAAPVDEKRAEELRKRYSRMRVEELRSELRTLGLTSDGTKPVLIGRLIEMVGAPPTQPATIEAEATEAVVAPEAVPETAPVAAPETAPLATLSVEAVKAMRVAELRVALEERDLSTEGLKPILASRLLLFEAARVLTLPVKSEAEEEDLARRSGRMALLAHELAAGNKVSAEQAPAMPPTASESLPPSRSGVPLRSTRSRR